MSHEIHGEEELERWEQEHDFMLRWACPQCSYEYEDRRGVNEASDCPICKVPCRSAGESYRA